MEAKINCDICHRGHHSKDRPFLCVVDARNRLYETRLEYTKALIETDQLEREVNTAISDETGQIPNKAVRLETLKSDTAAAVERTNEIIAQADKLRSEVDAARKAIEDKKKLLAQRRSDLEAVSTGAEARRSRQLEETQRAIHRTRYKWNRSADTMAATRAFLCEEAARLYGLRQVKKGSTKRFEIGGVEIFDLHAMNNLSPEVISTVFAHVAHILVLASHYLAIRLPAEITLPHRDYPRPTIFSVNSSYHHGDVPFLGTAMSGQSGNPRPRPLFIEKALLTLAKDDPNTYSAFLEGVGLLAHDVAWLCASQGVSFGDRESYDDVCNIGHNLWRLLIGDQLHRRSVEPTFPSSLTPPAGSPRDGDNGDVTKPKSMIGRWSHGTAHTSLTSAEGVEFVRNFKIYAPLKLADRLKKRLASEAPMLEWENIEGDEFEDGFEDVRAAGTSDGTSGGTGRGTSGWTRVKHR
ncbi:uncharacterized protein QC761_111680 [Podospora bellae-mahoneyi]|uniref:Autophagy-related protein 14 n=1 Tax=Podospora bellae-mahoneyi TaxID=2093777 RepID=A0ABR0FYC1_9PEZI|nr:hypothetical protein QC761_111680 [Podospora bellae-mahoneyi]